MIAVQTPKELQKFVRDLQILPQVLTQAVNDRHRGLVTQGQDRIIALHWLSDDLALLVETLIVEKTREEHHTRFSRLRFAIADWILSMLPAEPGKALLRKHIVRLLRRVQQSIRYHKVKLTLAVWLQPAMPGGAISRSSSLYEVLEIVAKSFGVTVVCFDGMKPAHLYSGPWDGKPPRMAGASIGSDCYLAGTFYRDFSTCELVWALNVSRYVPWYRKNLAGRVTRTLAMTPEAMIGVQQKVLEETLGVDWLRSKIKRGSKHPACERWKICEMIRQRNGEVKIPSELALAHSLLETMADNATLVQCTAGDRHRFSVGSLANYGDPAVMRRLKKVLLHDTQFGDALLELSCAAWHQIKGRNVQATEAEGMPDLRVTVPGWSAPVFADCKRVTAKSENVIEAVIRKANDQLGNAGITDDAQSGFGVVYIDITSRIGVLERSKGDDVPAEVQKVADLIIRRLYHHNRSVSAVVLLWRERVTAADKRKPPNVSLLLIWRSLVIRHRKPRIELPADHEIIRVQGTFALRVNATGAQSQLAAQS